jgi:hypothetical protein
VLVAVALIALLAVAVLLSRRPRRRVQVRSCCAARPWPPDDLTADAADPRP